MNVCMPAHRKVYMLPEATPTLVAEVSGNEVAIIREVGNAGPGGVVHLAVCKGEFPLQHLPTQTDAPGLQEVVQGGHVGSTCVRHPPLTSVFIIKLYLAHDVDVVPVCKDDEGETLLGHIMVQFLNLFWKELLLAVDQQQGPILGGIKAGQRGAKHLHKVSCLTQARVHVTEVGMNMITVPTVTEEDTVTHCGFAPAYRTGVRGVLLPVKRVILHAEVVAGEVPGWVAQVVKLVPEHSLGARRGGYDSGLHRETDRRED